MKEITITVEGIKYEIIYCRAAGDRIIADFKYNGSFYRVADDCAAMRELQRILSK